LKKIPEIIKVDIAGSVRRGRETIGDVDILIAAKAEDRKKIISQFTKMEDVSKVLAEGETKASILMAHFNRQVDLRIVAEDEWGAALQYFTGSKAHNIHLRKIAIEKGLKINEYGLFKVGTEKKIAGETEEGIYEKLGLTWMPPEMREDSGEIELAASGKIPELISLKDIKGDMHTHSKWSDGTFSLDEIAEYAAKNLSYDYLVITDHSKTEIIAGGLDEAEFEKQILEIREINKKQKNDFLKAGSEVDILADGTLDLSDELLKKLDWVVAAIHTQFKHDVTKRIIRACENPLVNAIAHLSGRLLGIREPYEIDLEKVVKAAASTGTALEINAHALRMDLDSKWARFARDKGVKLVIGTDAHNNDNYAYMKLGVLTARRAWCKAEDVLNTRSWAGIVDFKNEKLKKGEKANALMNF
jgi:DNA polymerase (family 10)